VLDDEGGFLAPTAAERLVAERFTVEITTTHPVVGAEIDPTQQPFVFQHLAAVALAVISAIRPATSQAAVFALLKVPAARRSLLAFSLAGLIVSTAIGLIIVVVFNGAGGALGRSRFTAVVDVLLGVAALAFAVGVQRGQLSRPRGAPQERPESRIAARLRRPSLPTAAAAGVATHVPGLIYLVALNTIAATQPSPAVKGVLQIA